MAKPDKAQISYMVGEGEDAVESTIRFHTVIAEEHEVTTRITKFPVMTGFNVSNHAIKENRRVTIQGAVTNHLIVGAEEFYEYGGINTKVMFETLKNLVRQSTPCDVVTNYGSYTPVIFTRFKTKLVAGLTDSMEFTLMGEEVQTSDSINNAAPTLAVFTILTNEERQARVDELTSAGYEVNDEAVISEAQIDMSESFQVEVLDSTGQTQTVTYEAAGYDSTDSSYAHNVHTSNVAVIAPTPVSYLNWFGIMQEEAGTALLPDVDLVAGASTSIACFTDGLVGIATDAADDYISTALGDLRRSVYGAIWEATRTQSDSPLGQALVSLGIDCLVAGAIGSVDPTLNEDDFQDNAFPTSEDVIEGAKKEGNKTVGGALSIAAPTTLTKISNPQTGGVSVF